jgi:hypothetical protein
MTKVFLSYSTVDYFFAEIAEAKLGADGIQVWRDLNQLKAGDEWRKSIEYAIADSAAVIVALSANSANSSYVTFEWAYALGKDKPIIPIRIGPCEIHPRLATIQHLAFTNAGALPWNKLIERIRETEDQSEPVAQIISEEQVSQDPYISAILTYLNQRGYQTASFDRLRRRIDESLTDERLHEIIAQNPTILRKARLKGGVPGLAKLVP